MIKYFIQLENTKLILWCYLIWYLGMATQYFTPSTETWLNAFGISICVGFALFISTGPASIERLVKRFWETFRLFACPFLVASFSAMVKGKGFIILFSPILEENITVATACMIFVLAVKLVSRWKQAPII